MSDPGSFPPVAFGVAGLGGYADVIIRVLEECGRQMPPAVRLAAVTDPEPSRHTARLAALGASGVRFAGTFEEMLNNPGAAVEAVWLPLPIDLHLPFTIQALAAGKAVCVEKPAAGCVQDVDQMIALRDRCHLPVAVGFQDMYDPSTPVLKRRILDGAIGPVRRAVLHACWGRDYNYFTRSPWAGRIRHNGAWVLDSPANNALAHFINTALFFLGSDIEQTAIPVEIEAELYRANAIENYDTCSLRVTVEGGVELLVLLTHACRANIHPRLRIEGERGAIDWRFDYEPITIAPGGKSPEVLRRDFAHERQYMARRVARLVRESQGLAAPGEFWGATLEQARIHTTVINGASEAAPVVTVPEAAIETIDVKGVPQRTIKGIEEAFTRCAASGTMLHESGLLKWTRPAGRRGLRNYQRFEGPRTEPSRP